MSPISTYYDLLFNIETSNYKLTWLEKDPKYYNELVVENEANQSSKKELDYLQILLLEDDDEADRIRIGYIHISNSFLNAFLKIQSTGVYYPDLKQGMDIPGYLFGLILNDYKTNLTTEGHYYPSAHIYMSKQEWPAIDLKSLLNQTKQDLTNIRFKCKMDAIKFYERIRKDFHKQIHILRELHIV
jgi:hypothetical protein